MHRDEQMTVPPRLTAEERARGGVPSPSSLALLDEARAQRSRASS